MEIRARDHRRAMNILHHTPYRVRVDCWKVVKSGRIIQPVLSMWVPTSKPFQLTKRCKAKCRAGHESRAHTIQNRDRCKNHGGLSERERKPEGKLFVTVTSAKRQVSP
jgi:hypothetical protein